MGEYYGVRMKDDPDGEYLQHWGVPKGFQRKAHKYLARLVTPSGYRYIYNQAQLAAAKAGRAIGNAIGLNQRSRAQQATARAQRISGGNKGREQSVQGIKRARMAKATAKRAQSAYDKTLLGRAEKAFNSARKGISDAASGAQKAANDAGKYLNRKAGNIRRDVERSAQKAIRSTETGRKLDNKYGVTKMGRQNKRSAEFKKKSLDSRYRTKNGMLDDNRRSNSEFANQNIRTGFSSGHGDDNPGTKQLKNYLNNRREEKRAKREARTRANNAKRDRMQQERVASVRAGKRVDPVWSNRADIKNPTKPIRKGTRKNAQGGKVTTWDNVPTQTWDNATKKEKKIRENVIRENVIPETIIREKRIKEKKIREKKKRR